MVQRSTSVVGIALGAAMLVALSGPAAAQDKIVSVSTLDRPPYTGQRIGQGRRDDGSGARRLRQSRLRDQRRLSALEARVDMAKKGTDGVIAYFPGYHCHHREGFVASEPIGNGPLGFAEHVDAPMT